ncbi:hypothetical protein [Streptomyces phaeochromogenes]|uniref:hypothetical protein n=1 Tax=Streptomyces phaeochromogenes TaxID=1923 RepID=UPI00371DB701
MDPRAADLAGPGRVGTAPRALYGLVVGALVGSLLGLLVAELRSVTGASTSSGAWKSSRLQDGPAVI